MADKIYVAGKWQDREAVKELMTWLSKQGYEITADWTRHELSMYTNLPEDIERTEQLRRKYAIEDLEGVKSCDLLIVVFEREYAYRGAWVELGIALGLHIPVYIIGHYGDSCIFLNLPYYTSSITKFDSVEDLKITMQHYNKVRQTLG